MSRSHRPGGTGRVPTTHTERAIDLLLYIQRFPRTFDEIALRYPDTSERTLWRHLRELREVAGMRQDGGGRYTIPVHMFTNGDDGRRTRR